MSPIEIATTPLVDAPIIPPGGQGAVAGRHRDVDGPSLIRVPEWVGGALGRYYLCLIVIASIVMSSMVADTVEDSQLRTGRRSEGVFFAARSFIQKSVHGIGVLTATRILTAIHFPQGARPGEVDAAVVAKLGLVYVPVLLTMHLISLLFVAAYRISRASHQANLARLQESGGDA